MAYFATTPCRTSEIRPILIDRMARLAGRGRWFALVDTAFDYSTTPPKVNGGDGLPIYHQGRLEPLAHVSPMLYELAENDAAHLDQQLGYLLRHCRGRPMLGFIRTDLSAQALREHWQALLEIETEDKQTYLLRFADTRVLPALAQREEIWNRLAANVAAWWIIDRDGTLTALDNPDAPVHDDTPLRIGPATLSALLQAGEADAMAEYMHEHFPHLLGAREGADNHRLLTQTLALSAACGINGTTEQYALGVAALLTNGRLLADPTLATWLAEKSWQTQGMEDALAAFIEGKEYA